MPTRTFSGNALSIMAAGLLSVSSVFATPLTRDNGAAVGDNQNSQTAGPDGPPFCRTCS